MALALMSMSVYAVDLKNQDGTRYEIKINSGATASSSSIEGNTTQSNVCGDCEIEVTGVGKISASGSETVIIKDGKLSKQ
jgi:hypothetical protein